MAKQTMGFSSIVQKNMEVVRQSADFPGLLKLPREKLEFERLPDEVLHKISGMEDITSKMRMFAPRFRTIEHTFA